MRDLWLAVLTNQDSFSVAKREGACCVGGRRGRHRVAQKVSEDFLHSVTLGQSFCRADSNVQPLALPLSPFFSFLDIPPSQKAVREGVSFGRMPSEHWDGYFPDNGG